MGGMKSAPLQPGNSDGWTVYTAVLIVLHWVITANACLPIAQWHLQSMFKMKIIFYQCHTVMHFRAVLFKKQCWHCLQYLSVPKVPKYCRMLQDAVCSGSGAAGHEPAPAYKLCDLLLSSWALLVALLPIINIQGLYTPASSGPFFSVYLDVHLLLESVTCLRYLAVTSHALRMFSSCSPCRLLTEAAWLDAFSWGTSPFQGNFFPSSALGTSSPSLHIFIH